MIFCALVNPAIDIVYRIDELELGSTRTDVPSQVFPAGKGINVAKAVRALGEDVCVVALMPENDARRFECYLAELGIECAFCPVEGGVRMSATVVENGPRQVTHINSAGPRRSPRVQDAFVEFAARLMRAGDTWALAGSLPEGFDDDTYMKMVGLCRQKQIPALLDTRGRALSMGVRAQPCMVKPNLSELEMLFGERVEGVHHIALKSKRLLDMGIEYAFVSLGADGTIAVHENECLLCSAPQVDAVDTVGCGDAFDAGVLVGHARSFSFPEMCRMAVACGASNALHTGAGVISREEVWRFMEDVRIEAV
ncbi:MAG: hexose kinase [Chitinivibrionales bacterium]|nr:hexose kinase [Chitinivibrionales bacterium]MBD3395118.1 hexose kinase [Chitinivibrionales bacterium]